MSIDELRTNMLSYGNDICFVYKGSNCGVESEFNLGVPKFEVWCGSATKIYSDFSDMIEDKFFCGKSVLDLVNEVEINFY